MSNLTERINVKLLQFKLRNRIGIAMELQPKVSWYEMTSLYVEYKKLKQTEKNNMQEI